MKLSGKLVAITGGSGGIGSLLTSHIIGAGGKVIVIDRVSPSAGEFLQGDLSNIEGIAKVGEILAQRAPDILINLAGIQYFGMFDKQPVQHVTLMHTINLLAPSLLAQAVIPAMRSRGNGQIVNIGSVFGSIPFAHFVTYSSTKAGLKALSQGLRRELAGSGIIITHISPRAVKTALNDARVMKLAEQTNMKMDPPDYVANRMLQAIEADKKDIVIGVPEAFFTRVNALFPGMVDNALAKNDVIARNILMQENI